MGGTVIDYTSPAEIVVTIDPSVGPPSSNEVVCASDTPLQICRDGFVLDPRAGRDDQSVVVGFRSRTIAPEWLYLEIVPRETSHVARLFFKQEDDDVRDVPLTCLPPPPRSASGTLRLNRMDISSAVDLHGVLDANLVGGGSVRAAF
jgi:hypothetical protein